MAITATLVEQGNNRLRYLLVCDTTGGTTLDITTTGAPTPDLLTDSLNGPVRECAEAFTDGIGILPAGAKTQAQARAIWLSDNSDTVLGNEKVPRTVCQLESRVAPAVFTVDANVNSGHPELVITSNDVGSAYLDVFVQGAIGI
jgi:hypothetical protein